MTLMDDLHRAVSVPEGEAQVLAMRSAYWIYERNPGLSLDEQAEGFAFLVAACLRIADVGVRQTSLHILQELSWNRSHTIGSQVDWDTFIQALPTWGKQKALHDALVLLCDANDARYLSALEHYFDHPDHSSQALSSWVALAFTERYTLDERVRPFLHHLAASLDAEAYESEMMQLVQTFLYNPSFPIDDVALTVKLLVDSALQSEEHRSAWRPIATAFDTRRYVGTYLDWDRLVAILPSLDDDQNDPKFVTLRCVLSCLSSAPEERFLDMLQPYLDHPHHYVRADAADAISLLLRHLAHYRPEAIFLARQIMEGISSDNTRSMATPQGAPCPLCSRSSSVFSLL